MPEFLNRPSVTFVNDLSSYSLTSVESTTLWLTLAWSKVYLIDYSTSLASVDLTNSLTGFPFTPCPSATAKKWVLLYSPKWGRTKKESWFTLFGFLGEYPVLVANANLVTQLSNFLFAYLGWTVYWLDVETSFEIEALTLCDPTMLVLPFFLSYDYWSLLDWWLVLEALSSDNEFLYYLVPGYIGTPSVLSCDWSNDP